MKHLLMHWPSITAAIVILGSAGQAAPATTAPAGKPRQIALWPDGRAPVNADGSETEAADVSLLVHHPATPNGTAMVVCAGGGYGRNLWHGAEGLRTAEWLNQQGIVAAVLNGTE